MTFQPSPGPQGDQPGHPRYADTFGILPLGDQPPSARSSSWKLFGGITAAVLALCCGGFIGLGLLVDDPGTNRAAATASEEARNEGVANPAVQRSAEAPIKVTSSPKVPSVEAVTATPARSVSPKPTRTPTTTRPATRPTPTRTPTKPTPTVTKVTPTRPPPTTKPPATDPVRPRVTPGAFCSTEGAYGIGRKNGKLYQCQSAGGDRARWRRV